MAHMQPDVQWTEYFSVETTNGTCIVPADVIGDLVASLDALRQYLDGEPIESQNENPVKAKMGWLARLSAPGYMDCTDWSVHESEQEARDYLKETYGDDEDEA